MAKLDKCAAAADPKTRDMPFNVAMQAPFDEALMVVPEKTKAAIDVAFNNIHRFHSKQVRCNLSDSRVL